MTVALAFSGGLDTSYCVARLREQGHRVHTVHVDTGGASAEDLARGSASRRSRSARRGTTKSRRAEVYDRFTGSPESGGNVLRGEVYPLSVAAERTQQAISVAETAQTIGAAAVAHGSTGAGNDQIRFDVAFRVLLPELAIVASGARGQADARGGDRLSPGTGPRRSHRSERVLDQPGTLGRDLRRRLDP